MVFALITTIVLFFVPETSIFAHYETPNTGQALNTEIFISELSFESKSSTGQSPEQAIGDPFGESELLVIYRAEMKGHLNESDLIPAVSYGVEEVSVKIEEGTFEPVHLTLLKHNECSPPNEVDIAIILVESDSISISSEKNDYRYFVSDGFPTSDSILTRMDIFTANGAEFVGFAEKSLPLNSNDLGYEMWIGNYVRAEISFSQNVDAANSKMCNLMESNKDDDITDLDENDYSIPDYTVTALDWWSQGLVSDDEIANSITFLIETELISSPNIILVETDIFSGPESQGSAPSSILEGFGDIGSAIQGDVKIPEYFKQNVEWMTQGLIGNKELIQGITHLMENDIIQVPNVAIKQDDSVEESSNSSDTLIETDDATIFKTTDGTVVAKFEDGSQITTRPDGYELIEYPDGLEITKYPDGSKISKKPDGFEILTYPDGLEVIIQPDGTKITKTPNGEEIITPSNSQSKQDTKGISNSQIAKYEFEIHKWNELAALGLVYVKGAESEYYEDISSEAWEYYSDNKSPEASDKASSLEQASRQTKEDEKKAVQNHKNSVELTKKAKQNAINAGNNVLDLEADVVDQEIYAQIFKDWTFESHSDYKDAYENLVEINEEMQKEVDNLQEEQFKNDLLAAMPEIYFTSDQIDPLGELKSSGAEIYLIPDYHYLMSAEELKNILLINFLSDPKFYDSKSLNQHPVLLQISGEELRRATSSHLTEEEFVQWLKEINHPDYGKISSLLGAGLVDSIIPELQGIGFYTETVDMIEEGAESINSIDNLIRDTWMHQGDISDWFEDEEPEPTPETPPDPTSCDGYEFNGSCISECPSDYIPSGSTCIQEEICTGYDYNGSCVTECPENYVPINDVCTYQPPPEPEPEPEPAPPTPEEPKWTTSVLIIDGVNYPSFQFTRHVSGCGTDHYRTASGDTVYSIDLAPLKIPSDPCGFGKVSQLSFNYNLPITEAQAKGWEEFRGINIRESPYP